MANADFTLEIITRDDNEEGWLGPLIHDRTTAIMELLDVFPIHESQLLFRLPVISPLFKRKTRVFPALATSDPDFKRWHGRLANDAATVSQWRALGLDRFISLCLEPPKPDPELFKAAICFWSTESNCFVLPLGSMTITLLDIAALTGISKPRVQSRRALDPATSIAFDRSYESLYNNNAPVIPGEPVSDSERVAFLHYWFGRFVLCTQRPIPDAHTSSAIFTGECVNLDEIVLCHLYRGLYTIANRVKEAPEACGILSAGHLWLLQLWLHAYFLATRGPLPALQTAVQDTTMLTYGHYLAKAALRKGTFTNYFTFFYEVREIPSFTPFAERKFGPASFKLVFDKPPPRGDLVAAAYHEFTEERKRYLTARDLLFAPTGSEVLSIETYNPQLAARQFNLVQSWPMLPPLSLNFPQFHIRSSELTAGQIMEVRGYQESAQYFPPYKNVVNKVSPQFKDAWNSLASRIFSKSLSDILARLAPDHDGGSTTSAFNTHLKRRAGMILVLALLFMLAVTFIF
ncbi:unnamed protein product [Linum trigynum]|uniref:Aminotransferase-like plant mobile domain-containing protein n=1 Tax=Linum trigynum TaxID=586398 RepID=A0AAV2ENN4_9ROSI